MAADEFPPPEDRLSYYRGRAKSAREAAEAVQDPTGKETLLRLAKAYEDIVARLELGQAAPDK
jgi:hypothetical protein